MCVQMEILGEADKYMKVNLLDRLNTTFALSIQSHYVRTWLSGEKDDVFIYNNSWGKHNGSELASYATYMEVPDFKKPTPAPIKFVEWKPNSPWDEDMEEVEEGEIVEDSEEEDHCQDEFQVAWRTRGFGNAEDHSILSRMLKEGRMKFMGFRLLVDLHQIFYREPEYLARVKKVVMYAIHFEVVKRIDFVLWGYAYGDYCSRVPLSLFMKHIFPMLRNLPEGITIGYVNTCKPGYDGNTKYTEWECQYSYDEEDVEEFSWLHYTRPEPRPLIDPLPELDGPFPPYQGGWTPPSSPKPEDDPRFDGWGNPSWIL